ncbi:hypothetical protein HOLleu_04437 [Holothuria leucospilota]|uniref:Uncharacterized protein n=1 Tax=Holothuria leucospilota TaxID=206669 RepID=A0A9Q1CUE9_HOLLE|nr:hypothetical protein HOLleu_04437 [Holothuria leucospilota]
MVKLCKESWNAKIKTEMSYSSDSANSQINTEGIRFVAHIRQSEMLNELVNLKDILTNKEVYASKLEFTRF